MIYTDNGLGITSNSFENSNGIGLNNLFFRAEMIRASADYDKHQKDGFTFTLNFETQ